MAIMPARETWTDERLDDLSTRVDDGFRKRHEEFQALRGEIKEEFRAVRGEVKAGFDLVNDHMLAQQRVMIQFGGAMFATTLLGFLGLLVTIPSQT